MQHPPGGRQKSVRLKAVPQRGSGMTRRRGDRRQSDFASGVSLGRRKVDPCASGGAT